jgi:hypothetical protein
MLRAVWRSLGSIDLSIRLLLAIALNLAVGSQYAKHLNAVYNDLNFLRFQEWLLQNGAENAWWVWTLFALLFLFSVNTAVCTGDRLISLLQKRKEYRPAAFALTIAPSLMHLCFLAIIGGHAVSQFTADIHQIPLAKGMEVPLYPSPATVRDSGCSYRLEPGLTGIPKECSATLSFSTPEGTATREIGILRPIFLEGDSIHLVLTGRPDANEAPRFKLVLKRDPGLALILLGNGVLCLLMLWYFPIIIRNRNGGRA